MQKTFLLLIFKCFTACNSNQHGCKKNNSPCRWMDLKECNNNTAKFEIAVEREISQQDEDEDSE